MLRKKIILSTLFCILLVGLPTSIYFTNEMTQRNADQAARLNTQYLLNLRTSLGQTFEEAKYLGVVVSADYRVQEALSSSLLDSRRGKVRKIEAHEQMNSFLRASKAGTYVNRLIVFNQAGTMIAAVGQALGSMEDVERIKALSLYSSRQGGFVVSSRIDTGGPCFAMILPIETADTEAWLYLELSIALIDQLLKPYAPYSQSGIADGRTLMGLPWIDDPDILPPSYDSPKIVNRKGRKLELLRLSLPSCSFDIVSALDLKALSLPGNRISYSTFFVVITSLGISILLAAILSQHITKPVERLIKHIQKIESKQFAPDPVIERGGDEIAEIGKTLNSLGMNVERLLQETEHFYEQKRKQEIALLQSQVNPHFLYNTLESIYWMATVQRAPGIAKMTRSLSSLLKNLAKGTNDKIPLRDELALVDHYVAIQQIRYVETFELVRTIPEELLDYLIIKFTLQPIVENALFHGLVPAGRFGQIALSARESGRDLVIEVCDDGIGMPPDRPRKLLAAASDPKYKEGLSGIGINNVHERLSLTYGKAYGLKIRSDPGKGTTATITIPKETLEDVQGSDC